MTKNSKIVALAVIFTVGFSVLVWVARDLYIRRQAVVNCADGPHRTIDIRDFTTQYWAYSVTLEADIANKAKVSAEVDPHELQEVSDALQECREFRQYVVAGYNSCAITSSQYAQLGARFSVLDGLAREINSLMTKPELSKEEQSRLSGLIAQFGDLARKLSS